MPYLWPEYKSSVLLQGEAHSEKFARSQPNFVVFTIETNAEVHSSEQLQYVAIELTYFLDR